jgi:hypothetical protein
LSETYLVPFGREEFIGLKDYKDEIHIQDLAKSKNSATHPSLLAESWFHTDKL